MTLRKCIRLKYLTKINHYPYFIQTHRTYNMGLTSGLGEEVNLAKTTKNCMKITKLAFLAQNSRGGAWGTSKFFG